MLDGTCNVIWYWNLQYLIINQYTGWSVQQNLVLEASELEYLVLEASVLDNLVLEASVLDNLVGWKVQCWMESAT